jgi:hypothetical protein
MEASYVFAEGRIDKTPNSFEGAYRHAKVARGHGLNSFSPQKRAEHNTSSKLIPQWREPKSLVVK